VCEKENRFFFFSFSFFLLVFSFPARVRDSVKVLRVWSLLCDSFSVGVSSD
jgi:hypothetical protein